MWTTPSAGVAGHVACERELVRAAIHGVGGVPMKTSEIAVRECAAEVCAAARRPIETLALDTLVGWLRPQFERILDRIDGPRRWAEHGERVRENSRHIGALADFFATYADSEVIGLETLTQALTLVRAGCILRAERIPLAFEYCPPAPVDTTLAIEFLRDMALVPEVESRSN
jgi:hypothetical protein